MQMAKEKIIQQGAEAEIVIKGREILKRRVKKSYRLPVIDDEIRKLRTRAEGRLMEKAEKIISVPKIRKIDEKAKEIVMDFVGGKKLSDNLDSFPLEKQKGICRQIGEEIAKLHDSDIIHGDLTTSNMIYVENKGENANAKNSRVDSTIKNGSRGRVGGNNALSGKNFRVFFIDFGLGFHSHKIEDKAVDLHLLKQALEAKHFIRWQTLFKEVEEGYSKSKSSKSVLEQFRKVEARGRYKDSY